MRWFEGNIAEAVALAKQKDAIFVVFIEGENPQSLEMSQLLQHDEVKQKLSDQDQFVSIRLTSGSEGYMHFAQIYQIVPVPSLFFIGHGGTPLEVVCPGLDTSALNSRIDKILMEHSKDRPIPMQQSTSSASIKSSTQKLLNAEATQSSTSMRSGNKEAKAESTSQDPSMSLDLQYSEETLNSADMSKSDKVDETGYSVNVTASKESTKSTAKSGNDPVTVLPIINSSNDKEKPILAESTSAKSVNSGKSAHNSVHFAESTSSAHPLDNNEANVNSSVVIDAKKSAEAMKVASLEDNKSMGTTQDVAKTLSSTSQGGPSAAKIQKPNEQEYEVVCDGDVCVRKPKGNPGPAKPISVDEPSTEQLVQEAPPSERPSESDVTDKVQRAKELIEMRRKEKENEEKELEKQRELERRAAGKGVADLKRWQQEQEIKHLQEERRREYLENARTRQRVLEQIARDRAETNARAAAALPAASEAVATPSAPAPPADTDATVARLQFKLADGTSHSAQFEPEAKLNEVYSYVASNLDVGGCDFGLWTLYPRAELTERESSLRQLGLCPSAVLMVLRQQAAAARYYTLWVVLTRLFYEMVVNPCAGAYSWLRQRLFPGHQVGRETTTSATGTEHRPRPYAPRAGEVRYRSTTNVHRLTDVTRDDDENNTWNGNSTQQM